MKSNIIYDNWHLQMYINEEAFSCFYETLDKDDEEVSILFMEEKEGSGIWKLEVIYQNRPDINEIDLKLELAAASLNIDKPVYEIGALPNRNWLKENIINFPPINIDNYYIYGSHITDEPPKDKISLKIDAATAFGSGEHATTSACVKAIGWVKKYYKKLKVRKVLDMGCGSGILGIAAAKTWKAEVIAVDIDEEAVRVTYESSKTNNVKEFVSAYAGNGYKAKEVLNNAPFDLILSNILARPLIEMAPLAKRNLKKGGIIVLSGLLISQEKWVLSAYEHQGLVLIKKYHIGEWSALILHG